MNSETEITLIEPYGGRLVDLLAREDAGDLARHAAGLPSLQLTPRSLCDLELLATGAFSPLTRFCGREDYFSILETLRLAGGTLFPIPITLSVHDVSGIPLDGEITLRNANNNPMAVMRVEEIFERDPALELKQICGGNPHHPLAREMASWGRYCLSGALRVIQLPVHYDFPELRHTPAEVRQLLAAMGNPNVVAFQTRNPMHRAHEELTKRAAAEVQASLLLQPVVGMTKPGDVDHYTRVRCYRAALRHYPQNTAMLSLLPLAMRMGGPREAVWHAIIRKNYGCTHLIVGRDHAGPGKDSAGRPFYGPYDAQDLILKHEAELGITPVPFKAMLYVEDLDRYLPEDEVPAGARTKDLSGTELRDRLMDGRDIPAWFSFPEVIAELRRTHPPRSKQGFTVFFTGLPSSGKSTLANVLLVKLLEIGGRPVTLLDGDIVRTHLSSELGFSKEHRDINIRRIGFVASEITKNGGIAICAPIAPYDTTRKDVRAAIEAGGGFILVHVSTPVEVCEQRDRKGLYAKARAGLVKEFTGVSDPYEVPQDADLAIDTSDITPEEGAQAVILHLERKGYIATSR